MSTVKHFDLYWTDDRDALTLAGVLSDEQPQASIPSAPTTRIPFCPHEPHPKQRLFLELDCLEAFFGGAAGGGKSAALLMAALQHVHVPGYAALILRKDTQRLALAGGLIPRSHEWLAGQEGVKWHSGRRQWTFDTGGAPATLTFGYLKGPYDKFRYASSEYQLIAFDELTELAEDDYLFLFSRLRRTTDMPVPLRIRSASNPGNIGHLWVKQRFIGEKPSAEQPDVAALNDPAAEVACFAPSPSPFPQPSPLLWHQGRAYVPSRIADNPSLPEAEYRATLSHLPPLARERLMNGDWDVQEEAQIKPEWLRYFVETALPGGAAQFELLDASGRSFFVVPESACRRFITVDPAGTSAEKAREARGRPRSWTVAQVWDQPRHQPQFLLLRHEVRRQVGFGGILHILRQLRDDWKPEKVWIESEHLGKATVEQLAGEMTIEGLKIGTDKKLERAAPLLVKFELGQVFLPRYENSWRPDFERELLAWTGNPDEPADQIDAAAYAARVAAQQTTGILRIEPLVTQSRS